MEYKLLSGMLALLIAGGLAISPAFAQQAVIDNFDDEDNSCDITYDGTTSDPPVNGETTCTDTSPMAENTIGAQRDYRVGITGGIGTTSHIVGIGFGEVINIGIMTYSATANTVGFAEGTYGGAAAMDQLNNDFESICNQFQITIASSDSGVSTTITLRDGDGTIEGVTKDLASPGAGTTTWFFSEWGVGMDFSEIDEIVIMYETASMNDFTLTNIGCPVQIGGTIMPADTTALLLAGAELNAMWILPMIAAIGIGAFIVSRKRK